MVRVQCKSMSIINRYTQYIFLIIAIILFIYPVIGTDFGWHLRVGEYIVDNRAIPYTDFLSFSMEGYPYVFHSWLASVGMYLAHAIGGLWGVSLFFAVLLSIGLLVAVYTTNTVTGKVCAAALFLTPFVVAAAGIRTQAASYVMLSLLFFILSRAKAVTGVSRSFLSWIMVNKFWMIPGLFAMWSNLHGGFSLGLALLVVFLGIVGFIEYRQTKNLKSVSRFAIYGAGLIALSVLATGFNPYGFRQLQQAISMQTNMTAIQTNLDWRPLFRYEGNTMSTYSEDIVIVLMVILGIVAVWRQKTFPRQALLLVTFLIACFITTRFSLIILVIALPSIITLVAQLVSVSKKTIYPGLFGLGFAILITIGMSGIHIAQATCVNNSPQCYAGLSRVHDTSPHYPYEAAVYMERHGVPQRLFNNYNHGGYLHYYFPNHQFFIDGRMDNFFIDGKSFVEEYFQLIYAREGWEEKFAQYRFDGYLGRKEWPLTQELLNRGWYSVNEDDVNVLLRPPVE